ncbi:MAG: porin family protein [Acidobacteria bacterium]|nr:porin family protein [Acidobacteriota bacterium]
MRKILFTIWMILVAFLTAKAQGEVETPKAELFGGYSYAGEATHGWNVSVAGNVNRWLGLVADVSGQRTSLERDGVSERIRTHSFLFGPRFSVRRKGRVTPFVHALFGAAHTDSRATESGLSFHFTDTSFASALGGGLDVRVSPRVAVRAFQAEYVRTQLFGGTQNKGRIAFGVVFRLGKK